MTLLFIFVYINIVLYETIFLFLYFSTMTLFRISLFRSPEWDSFWNDWIQQLLSFEKELGVLQKQKEEIENNLQKNKINLQINLWKILDYFNMLPDEATIIDLTHQGFSYVIGNNSFIKPFDNKEIIKLEEWSSLISSIDDIILPYIYKHNDGKVYVQSVDTIPHIELKEINFEALRKIVKTEKYVIYPWKDWTYYMQPIDGKPRIELKDYIHTVAKNENYCIYESNNGTWSDEKDSIFYMQPTDGKPPIELKEYERTLLVNENYCVYQTYSQSYKDDIDDYWNVWKKPVTNLWLYTQSIDETPPVKISEKEVDTHIRKLNQGSYDITCTNDNIYYIHYADGRTPIELKWYKDTIYKESKVFIYKTIDAKNYIQFFDNTPRIEFPSSIKIKEVTNDYIYFQFSIDWKIVDYILPIQEFIKILSVKNISKNTLPQDISSIPSTQDITATWSKNIATTLQKKWPENSEIPKS